MALGEHPVVTLKEARDKHHEARKVFANGVDPMAERKAEAEAKQKEVEARQREEERSFESVSHAWWAWWSIGKSPRHADTVMRRLKADVFPAFGHKSMEAIKAADIRALMLAVEKRDARDVAKRCHEMTSQIFDSQSLVTLPLEIPPPISSRETSWLRRGQRIALVWTPRICPNFSRRWTITTGTQSRALL